MANVKKPRGEDPQAETRTAPPAPAAAPGVAAPRVVTPAGGAPKINEGPSITVPRVRREPQIEAPTTGIQGLGEVRPPRPSWDELKAVYDQRNTAGTWRPAGIKARPWAVDQSQTRTGLQYRERLDASTMHDAPAPPWTIQQVKEAEPEFVADVRDRLWEMYATASESERATTFMQGVRQNPEYAAATVVRRMLHNSQVREAWMTGEVTPKLGEAAQNALQMNDTWRWLNYVLGNQQKPVPAPSVPPPQGATGAGANRKG